MKDHAPSPNRTTHTLHLHTTTYTATAPRCNVVITHGYAEHSGRYESVATHLQSAGFTTTTFDLRGYGKSKGPEALVSDFSEYIDDLVSIVGGLDQLSNVPLVLLGHSMGGLVVLKSILDHAIVPDAAILSSPALGFFEPKLLQDLGAVISRVFPSLKTVKLDRTLISRDPAIVGAAIADPLSYHGRVKAKTGSEMVRISREVTARAHEVALPFLIMHGTADRITNHHASEKLYEDASSTDKTIRLFEDAYHELLNDHCRDEVLEAITQWLTARF